MGAGLAQLSKATSHWSRTWPHSKRDHAATSLSTIVTLVNEWQRSRYNVLSVQCPTYPWWRHRNYPPSRGESCHRVVFAISPSTSSRSVIWIFDEQRFGADQVSLQNNGDNSSIFFLCSLISSPPRLFRTQAINQHRHPSA